MLPHAVSRIAVGALIALLQGTLAMGTIKPQVQLHEVSNRADTIIAGTVVSVEATERVVQIQHRDRIYEFSAWRATLKAEQVIKGRTSTKEIIVEFPGPGEGDMGFSGGPLAVLEHLNPGERVVVYLSSKDGGQVYSFADPYRSAVRIGQAKSITQLLHSPLGQAGVDDHVASLIAASIEAASRATIEQSVLDLVNLKGSEAASALKAALGHSNDTAIRAVILEGLLRIGDYSELQSAIETVSAIESDSFACATQMVLGARMGLVDDPELVRQHYYPLLKHPKAFMRRSAAYAIRKAGLKEAVPYLIEGLQDRDAETRYQCMMALAEILGRGGEWAPSKERFEESEGEYIERWQAWWTSSGQFEFRTPVDEGLSEGESSSSEVLSPPSPGEASAARGDGGG